MSSSVPSREEALRILREAGCPPEVIRHCQAVASLALRIARACSRRGLKVDLALVEAGALLHDIGRSRTHSIAHVFIGAELARQLGLDERLIRIILTHSCGVEPEQAVAAGWPPGDYRPEALEEKIVAYADKLVERGRIVPFERALAQMARELGPEHPSVKCLASIRQELLALLGDELDSCCRP